MKSHFKLFQTFLILTINFAIIIENFEQWLLSNFRLSRKYEAVHVQCPLYFDFTMHVSWVFLHFRLFIGEIRHLIKTVWDFVLSPSPFLFEFMSVFRLLLFTQNAIECLQIAFWVFSHPFSASSPFLIHVVCACWCVRVIMYTT